jgi:hypothetical protein
MSGSSVVLSPTGRPVRPSTTVSGLVAGCFSAAEVRAAVVPAPDLDPAGRIDGLIGQDVLFNHIYTLDYARGVLLCHPDPGEPRHGVRLALTVVDGQAMVSLPQARGGLRLVPDSGADRLVLFSRRGQRLTPLVTPLDTVRSRSVTGQRLTRRVLVQGLVVGGTSLGDHEGMLLDATESGGLMGDGLLPLHLFAAVTFNGPGAYLVIEPRR